MGVATATMLLHMLMCRVESIQLKVYEEDYKHNIILSCSKDSTIKYWNIKRYHTDRFIRGYLCVNFSGRCIRTLSLQTDTSTPLNCAYCNDMIIASTSADCRVRIWNFSPHASLYSTSVYHNHQ